MSDIGHLRNRSLGDEAELQSKITTLTAGLLSDLQSPFHADMPLAVLAHYDIEFRKLFHSHTKAAVLAAQITELGAILSIFTSGVPNHKQVVELQQAKDRLAALQAQQANINREKS